MKGDLGLGLWLSASVFLVRYEGKKEGGPSSDNTNTSLPACMIFLSLPS